MKLSLRPTTKFIGVSTFQKSTVHYFASIKRTANAFGYNHTYFNPLQSFLHLPIRFFATPSTNKNKPRPPPQRKPQNKLPKKKPSDTDEEEEGVQPPSRRKEKFAQKANESSIKLKKNYEIKSFEVRVIGPEGALGIMKIGDAIKLAQQHNLDLVEVGPNAVPPVCKITSFQKMEFDANKKSTKASAVKHKEMVFTTVIASHDFDTKTRKVREMLEKNQHVTITITLPKPVLTPEQLKERYENKNKKSKKEEEEEFKLPLELQQAGLDMATKISLAVETVGKTTKAPTIEHLQYKVLFDLVPGKRVLEAQKKAAQQAQGQQAPTKSPQQEQRQPQANPTQGQQAPTKSPQLGQTAARPTQQGQQRPQGKPQQGQQSKAKSAQQ